MKSIAYMQVKSSKQGTFMGDGSGARSGREKWSLVRAVRFRGEQARDTGQKNNAYSATKHDPITFVREWTPSPAQFAEEMWNNRKLDEVVFEFVRYDTSEQERVFATLKLTNVLVEHVELRFGNTREWSENPEHESVLEHIGLVPQEIEFKVKDKLGGDAVAHYDKNAT
jgi:type VI secretion system Hcp family effector